MIFCLVKEQKCVIVSAHLLMLICICICIGILYLWIHVSAHSLMLRCPSIYHRWFSHARHVKNLEQLFSSQWRLVLKVLYWKTPCTNLRWSQQNFYEESFRRLHTLCKYWDNEAIIVGFWSPFLARITPSQMNRIMQQHTHRSPQTHKHKTL